MKVQNNKPIIEIKIENQNNLTDLILCAKEFIDFIDHFKKKYINKKLFILSAYYNKNLAGILVAENCIQKIDSLKNIIPKVNIYFLFINQQFRDKHLGNKLLKKYQNIQKRNGIASIIVKIPQKYKIGIAFFKKNNFIQVGIHKNQIILEKNLWNDYGVRNCDIIEKSFNGSFN